MWRRFSLWKNRSTEEQELDEELRAHIAIETQRRIEAGEDPSEAAAAARRAFGNVASVREETREAWGWSGVERFFEDTRYGMRMLRKSPGWTAVMSATLALGIGLTTAIFSLVYSILLQPLPYAQPDRLLALWTTGADPNLSRMLVNGANWRDWRERAKSYEDIGLTRPIANFNLTGDGQPERLQGARMTWNVPQILGVPTFAGRMFTEEETKSDARVAVLSYAFWERRFGRDPRILGRKIQLNGGPFEIIGVMPATFHYPAKEFELWTPLFIPPNEFAARFDFQYQGIARLKPGVTREQAQAELTAIMRRLAEEYPNSNGVNRTGAVVEPLLASTVGQYRTTLYVLLAAVGCLLLIGCINLGGLLVARASARAREIALRAALGASGGRLRRQMLAEVAPLSVVGATGGVVLAWWLLEAIGPWLPPQLPRTEAIGLHGPVLAFAIAMSVVVVLLAGMLPARLASRVPLAGSLQQDSRSVAGGGRTRNTLAAAQVAVTLVLVFASGLLVRSLIALLEVSPGFSPDGVLTMHLAVTRAKHRTDPEVAEYYRRIAERVKSIPGVIDAGVVNRLPMAGIAQINPVEFENKAEIGRLAVDSRSATPGYFRAMGISLVRGRLFTDQDVESAPGVGIIDEQMAARVFGKDDPIGKRFRFGVSVPGVPWVEIVGVVAHVRNDDLETDPRPQVYWPEGQRAQDRGALVVRTAGRPDAFTSAVIGEIRKEDADQPVYDVRSMNDWVARTMQSRNLLTALVTLFGGSSLLLACLGLYGVVSYGAGLRLREFGIRLALGARPGDVRWLVLTYAARLTMWGAAVGLLLVWPAGRALRSVLFGVGSADVVVLATAPCILFVVASLAGLGPARRAGRVDPAVALRAE